MLLSVGAVFAPFPRLEGGPGHRTRGNVGSDQAPGNPARPPAENRGAAHGPNRDGLLAAAIRRGSGRLMRRAGGLLVGRNWRNADICLAGIGSMRDCGLEFEQRSGCCRLAEQAGRASGVRWRPSQTLWSVGSPAFEAGSAGTPRIVVRNWASGLAWRRHPAMGGADHVREYGSRRA